MIPLDDKLTGLIECRWENLMTNRSNLDTKRTFEAGQSAESSESQSQVVSGVLCRACLKGE